MSTAEIQALAKEVKTLVENINPWVDRKEMMTRYRIKDPHTITAMEKDGRLPTRCANGLWSRSELLDWEAAQRRAA